MPSPTLPRHRDLLAALLICSLLAVPAAVAAEPPVRLIGPDAGVVHGGHTGAVKAEVDTTYLLGGPDRVDGRFEDAGGQPTWHGFTSRDHTDPGPNQWQLHDVDPLEGARSMWCGTEYDDGPGYGNDWNEVLLFAYPIEDPQGPSTVHWTGQLRVDTEPEYDFVYLEVNRAGEWDQLAALDGTRPYLIDETIALAAGEYAGDDGDELQLRIRFRSDGAWSDEDGLFESEGACWADALTVAIDGEIVDTEDFEDDAPGRWQPWAFPGVGDFARLWVGLMDLDPCHSNTSSQVAFIDDGEVVPGTGGSQCITWCYGPGGYVVNTTGGLMGEGFYLHNSVESPVLEWPDGHDAVSIAFDVYRHEELGDQGSWPGIFYTWGVRSASDPENHPIEEVPWSNRAFAYSGGPEYVRHDELVTDLMAPDRQQVQVRVSVVQYGWIWGWDGHDATPAPYFDNFSVKVWPHGGPALSARPIDLASDAFPASGELDLDQLATNSVRFDMARNIAPAEHLHNDPGDSLIVRARVVSAGAELVRMPRMYVAMRANPVFDPHRELPPTFSQAGELVTGWVEADSVDSGYGFPYEDIFSFDLPDTGFFYPGDVIHYYVEAGDVLAGDERWAILPADTADFHAFGPLSKYDRQFTVRALPSVLSDIPGDQPSLLVWDDADGSRDFEIWRFALRNLGYRIDRDYDLYTTRSAAAAVGNGLGGRATSAQLAGYGALVYTCGDLTANLLSDGDPEDDPSQDLAVVTAWFGQGAKRALMTGDDLVSGLLAEGTAGDAFVDAYLGATVIDQNITLLIGNQFSPTVAAIPGTGVVVRTERWVAHGGCPDVATFDAVELLGTSERLAEFTDPQGNEGMYTYAAAWMHEHEDEDAMVIALPYDLTRVMPVPGWEPPTGYAGIPARAVILEDILGMFDLWPIGPPIAAEPPARALAVRGYPNPFNPMVTLALDLPRAGEAIVRIYNVRGQLVRELARGEYTAGHHELVWNGRDDRGGAVASGVYFAEVRSGPDTELTKLTLVR
ncbi:hypothetical protein GF314_01935 [bacterium]|nr:hypothetical protein [bacterium]